MSKAQLARLIDLPEEALQQVLEYAQTLSKAEAVEHFANLLGDSPAAASFVADFNSRRHDPAGPSAAAAASAAGASQTPTSSAAASVEAVPKSQRNAGKKKKKTALHTPPPRQVVSTPLPGTAYNKKDVNDEYMTGSAKAVAAEAAAAPVASAAPSAPLAPAQPKRKLQSAGSFIQDALLPKTAKNKEQKETRSGTGKSGNGGGAAATKITITGGTAMHGAATALADFDAAIRALEMSTNPTTAAASTDEESVRARRCHCVATRHPLQTAAPNCMGCGKVICVKEGLGPCTFCGRPLLTPSEVQAIIQELRQAMGREKMEADRRAHARPDKAGGSGGPGKGKTAQPTMVAGQMKWGGDDKDFLSLAEAAALQGQNATPPPLRSSSPASSEHARARAHRDKLLAFQSQNAQRTTVRDEAADFDMVPLEQAGGLWATPEERARELRKQQKLLREMEWNARPEYEKRRQVLSIDLAGRKVFKKVAAVTREEVFGRSDTEEDEEENEALQKTPAPSQPHTTGSAAGTYSRNPLLGRLIKPVYGAGGKNGDIGGKGKGKGKGKDDANTQLLGRKDDPERASRWQRVQDNLQDNEAVILDGGLHGKAVED